MVDPATVKQQQHQQLEKKILETVACGCRGRLDIGRRCIRGSKYVFNNIKPEEQREWNRFYQILRKLQREGYLKGKSSSKLITEKGIDKIKMYRLEKEYQEAKRALAMIRHATTSGRTESSPETILLKLYDYRNTLVVGVRKRNIFDWLCFTRNNDDGISQQFNDGRIESLEKQIVCLKALEQVELWL